MTDDVRAAVDAGAEFLVPHLDRALLERMLESGLHTMPGVFTPSEVAVALDAGAAVVKLFPGDWDAVRAAAARYLGEAKAA
jgi:2-keto-3-deoxy-6-phosphogluconate aldolase